MRVLLVPNLRLEGWRAMDRYAEALAHFLPAALPHAASVTTLPDPGYPAWARYAARWLAYPRTINWNDWDVVHVLDHSYAHVLHRRAGRARTVITVHDLFACDPLARQPGLRGAVLHRVNAWVLAGLRNADVCLCDSRATLAALGQHFPDAAGRARHEPLGVDARFFIPDLSAARRQGREYLGLTDDAAVILHVGSCAPRKNVPALLRAMAELTASRPALCLVQVGGRFSAADRTLIDVLGLAARVRQRAHMPESTLPNVYAAADVLAMPSLFEGFGLPVLEAFAVGVPVVATRLAALADFPEGLLHAAGCGSVDEIRRAIEAALDDRREAAAKATAAREWARAYTWERVAAATARVYGGDA